jgi:hypothetical protein
MKELNGILMGCIAIVVGYCASFFFLGGEESLNQLRQDFFFSFLFRFIGCTLFGLFWFIPLIVLNLIGNRFAVRKIPILQLIKYGALIISIGSLVGTIIFHIVVIQST